MTDVLRQLQTHAIPGRVAVVPGNGGLSKIVVTTGTSTAEIYPHGAHVAHFQKNGEQPLIFMSRQSWFAPGKPIRGGVPICFPWFGARDGAPAHGLARITEWQLVHSSATPDGDVTLRLVLPHTPALNDWRSLRTEFVVTVSDALTMELIATRESGDGALRVENCLHTYFEVGDIDAVSLTGLGSAPFDDFAAGAAGARKIEHGEVLHITKETNRVYPGNTSAVDIRDDSFGRTIRVEKSGSNSTVVWNPWTTQKLPEDFDPAEYRRMVCVESGNVKQDALHLEAGQRSALKVVVSSARAAGA